MKKVVIALALSGMFLMAGCGQELVTKEKTYETYGLFNKQEIKQQGVQYELIWGNIALSVIFSETIIIPIYFFGFDLYEPIAIIKK